MAPRLCRVPAPLFEIREPWVDVAVDVCERRAGRCRMPGRRGSYRSDDRGTGTEIGDLTEEQTRAGLRRRSRRMRIGRLHPGNIELERRETSGDLAQKMQSRPMVLPRGGTVSGDGRVRGPRRRPSPSGGIQADRTRRRSARNWRDRPGDQMAGGESRINWEQAESPQDLTCAVLPSDGHSSNSRKRPWSRP